MFNPGTRCLLRIGWRTEWLLALRSVMICGWLLAGSFFLAAGSPAEVRPDPNALTLVELDRLLASTNRVASSFQLEGSVLAVNSEISLLVLQDATTVMMLELPVAMDGVRTGDRVSIEGHHCLLVRTRFGVRMAALPVVDNDGLHSKGEVSGSVDLKPGWHPLRLEWFNGPAEYWLGLEYDGPGIQRMAISNDRLRHSLSGSGTNDLRPGVGYRAYEGHRWLGLPDFSHLNVRAAGVMTNFSLACRTRDEDCGLVFEGLIEIRQSGTYSFHLTSDDGSRLYIGRPSVRCRVVAPRQAETMARESFEQALADRGRAHWIELGGEVSFASVDERSREMTMVVGANQVPVTVVDGGALSAANLLHRWVRVAGVGKFSRNAGDHRLAGVFVPGSAEVKISDGIGQGQEALPGEWLTTAAQVRRLKSAEARQQLPVRIRGVVIYASSATMVLRDATAGVFVGADNRSWAEPPEVGELWEIRGRTDPGDFSPVVIAEQATYLGDAPLPEPIQPTRDQLMNGNLDAEYAELRGVVTSVSSNAINLLTPDGHVTVLGGTDRPVPQLPESLPAGASVTGSVVRIRGCFATLVDLGTRHVIGGQVFVYPSQVEIEDPSPANPFLLPARAPAELMWFNARASALQRTKLTGEVLYALPGEYFVFDGQTGFRVRAEFAPPVNAGDLVAAVGFPKLDGPSPVLQAAQIQVIGHAALPKAKPVASDRLFDRNLDSTPVTVDALLISDTLRQDERTLELQAGSSHFLARLKRPLPATTSLPGGCRLQLTGVYVNADENRDQVGTNIAPFELWLADAQSVVVLQRPSWWTLRRVVAVAVTMAGLLCVAFTWVVVLRRQVEERTTQLKIEIEERQLAEQHHAVERERTRVARDLHDELGAGLTEVSMLGSLANTPAVPVETRDRYLEQITQTARSLVSSLDEIVWAVNPSYDSVGSLVSYFSLFAESFLNLAGITCRLQVAEDLPECPLDARHRHAIFCVFKEALNNVIQHARATEVRIAFDVRSGELMLSVVDNGCGFELVGEVPGRDGLAGIRQRMQQLDGECQVTSQPGHGTRVEIHLPLKKNLHGQNRDR